MSERRGKIVPFKNPHPLYSIWQGMLNRCRNPKAKQWQDYGGRGISVCERWKVFANFAADMGPRPDGHSLDRFPDKNGNYEPSNCRWATRKEQQRNTRDNRMVTIEGVEYLAVEVAERCGLKTDTIVVRASQGLTMAEVLDPKVRVYKEGLARGGKASGAKQQAKTHCKNGHAFTAANTAVTKEGWRRCRRCHADRQIERNHRGLQK